MTSNEDRCSSWKKAAISFITVVITIAGAAISFGDDDAKKAEKDIKKGAKTVHKHGKKAAKSIGRTVKRVHKEAVKAFKEADREVRKDD